MPELATDVVDDIALVTITVTCPKPGPEDDGTGVLVVPDGGCLNGGIPIEITAMVGGSVQCGMCGTVLVEEVTTP